MLIARLQSNELADRKQLVIETLGLFCLAATTNIIRFHPQQQQRSSNLSHYHYHRSASCNWGHIFQRIISTKALSQNYFSKHQRKFSLFTSAIKGHVKGTGGKKPTWIRKNMSKERKNKLTLNYSRQRRQSVGLKFAAGVLQVVTKALPLELELHSLVNTVAH